MTARQKKHRLLFALLVPAFLLAGCHPQSSGSSAVSPSEPASSLSSEAPSEAPSSSLLEETAALISRNNSSQPESEESKPAVPSGISAKALYGASVYAQPADGEILLSLEAGAEVSVTKTKDPLWYAFTAEDGAQGYLYGEALYRVEEDGATAKTSLFAEYSEDQLAWLLERFPEGKYWNHMGQDIPYGEETPFLVTDIPCDHDANGELHCNFYNGALEQLFPNNTICQCMGFASILSDQLFGTAAPLYNFDGYDLLRVGDHIRLHEYEHSMTVVEKTDDYVTVAEANANYLDCRIEWSRRLSRSELDGLQWDSEYISRYPLRPAGNGTFVSWDQG